MAKVQVSGLREARKAFRRAEDKEALDAVKRAHREAADAVLKVALPMVPVRTGTLKGSVKTLASRSRGRVKAGTRVRVPYAGPIHFGWPGRGIEAQPFLTDALERTRGDVDEVFMDALHREISLLSTVRGFL